MVPRTSRKVDQSDQDFVDSLRAAVAAYLQAVDEWEATYNRYYRLPGHAHVVSSDMESEQREFEAQRLVLSSLLARAGQLCLKYGLANPFPRLLRSSLGQYVPQQRVESAVSRNERNAVTTCLEQLTDECRGCPPAARPMASAPEVRPSAAPVARRTRGWVILTVTVGAFTAMVVGVNWLSSRVRLPAARNLDQQPYGRRSGDDLRASWEAERKKESARFTDADLQRMVDRLFVEDDPGRVNFHGLLYAAARPLPFLLKAFDDPRMSTIVFDKKGFDPIEMSPFGRICSLLDNLAPVEAAKPLARYLEHPDPKFRCQAASLLARIGCADCLEPVKKALADGDHELREFALIGLNGGLERQQRDEKFLSGVFPVLVPLLNAGTYLTVSPAGVMMAADPVRAAPILESPRYFAVRNPQLREVLAALDHKDVKVPREILLPLLAQLEPLATKESREEQTYAVALVLYANNPDDRAEIRFWTLVHSPSSTIASTAARGLEVQAGITPHDAVWDAYNKRGFAAMTEPQQFYFAIELYRDEVNNGGHSQYFYNDDSDLYHVAIEGLRTIGAPSKAAILSEAAGAFAPVQAAPTESVRRNQMEEFGPVQSRIFEMADKRFYSSENEPGERLERAVDAVRLETSQRFCQYASFESAMRHSRH
jgi:Domain of unknown function (DUF4375)